MSLPIISQSSQGELGLDLSLERVQRMMSRHIPLYRRHKPNYQVELIGAFAALWSPTYRRVLDVGGGTGIVAQAMKDLFAVPHVVSIDVANRFLPTLDIETRVYGGKALPFADSSFDCVTFSNVLHHVHVDTRAHLLRECARVVGGGPILIKDHLTSSAIDHARLFALDGMGNLPFGGMIKARYLDMAGWEALAASCNRRIDACLGGRYRTGLFERMFPNRLEATLRLVPEL